MDLGLNADLMVVVVGVVFGIMEGGSASGDGIAFHASRSLCKPKVKRQKNQVSLLSTLMLHAHMRTALFLIFTFIKEGLKTAKVKSTACSSKEIKTNHQRAFCATHRLLSYP